MINYDRHNIATLFGLPPENMPVLKDNGEVMQKLARGVRDANEEQSNVNEGGERVEQTMGLTNILTVSSLPEAVQDARTEMLSKIDRGHPPMVFQVYAQIFTPILANDEPEYEFLRKLADSSSYIELREKVRAAGASVSPELLTEVRLRLTDLMNSILHNQLSILPEEVTVEDFVQDLDALLNLLKSNYSERMQKAFLKDQSLRLKAVFGFPDTRQEAQKEVHDILRENSLTQGWKDREDKPDYTFFGPTVRMSFLNVISHDLMLAGQTKVANILTRQMTPALYDLAEQVFKSGDDGMLVARQLVITKDGRILELHQASLVEDGYLVSLVK